MLVFDVVDCSKVVLRTFKQSSTHSTGKKVNQHDNYKLSFWLSTTHLSQGPSMKREEAWVEGCCQPLQGRERERKERQIYRDSD